jgi:hypothetical protein
MVNSASSVTHGNSVAEHLVTLARPQRKSSLSMRGRLSRFQLLPASCIGLAKPVKSHYKIA